MEALELNNWQDNVRELENVVQSTIIKSEYRIDIEQLPDYLKYPTPSSKNTSNSLKQVEKEQILKIMVSVDNNKNQSCANPSE